ncbi:MAG: HD domain-containing protein [Brevinematales bacterium]|nr:HD domain-containing protein [Brevinematales bacterium]
MQDFRQGFDEIRVPLKVSKFFILEGDILDEDILYYDNLKKGLVLDSNTIGVIQKLDQIKDVRVLRYKSLVDAFGVEKKGSSSIHFTDDFDVRVAETVNSFTDYDVKMGFSDEKINKKISEAIRNTILNIRGKDYEDKVDKTTALISDAVQKDQIVSQTMLLDVRKTIREISQSFVDAVSLKNVIPIKAKKEVVSLNLSNKSISNYFLDLVVTDKVSFVSSAKSVILKFINSFGDDNSGIVLSSMLQYSDNDDYVVAHSIFVMALSIMIAKELTNIVYEKISSNQNSKIDPRSLKLISLKTFDLDDLINIGLAALLHDVGIRKNFGVIPPSYKIPSTNISKIELHPSESSFFVQKLSLDVSVQRAVYEHHEFLDGSGYPKGLKRYMSKYSPIIAFAEKFSELVLENPFIERPISPAVALGYILKNEIGKYDKDVIFAFVRATSTYPIGSWIQISNGMIGFVKDVSPKDRSKQVVKLVFNESLNKIEEHKLVDLAEYDEYKIIKIMNPIELSKRVGDLRQYYFD